MVLAVAVAAVVLARLIMVVVGALLLLVVASGVMHVAARRARARGLGERGGNEDNVVK